MAKMIGDRLTSSIYRGGFTNVEWQITRSGTPTWESIWPVAPKEGFTEDEVSKRGLDGTVHVLYYKQSLSLLFLQTDSETLQDLYALSTILHSTGISTKITLCSGKVLTLTMRFSRRYISQGYSQFAQVELVGESVSATSVFA